MALLLLPDTRDLSTQGDTLAEWMANHANVLYPVVFVFGALMLLVGIIYSFRVHSLRGLEKSENKRAIIVELRKHRVGLTGDELGQKLRIESFQLVQLLEELKREGALLAFTNTDRRTVWSLANPPPPRA